MDVKVTSNNFHNKNMMMMMMISSSYCFSNETCFQLSCLLCMCSNCLEFPREYHSWLANLFYI